MKKSKILLAFVILLTSVIYGLPHIIVSARLGAGYRSLVISKSSPIAKDELYAYAPEVSYIKNGHEMPQFKPTTNLLTPITSVGQYIIFKFNKS